MPCAFRSLAIITLHNLTMSFVVFGQIFLFVIAPNPCSNNTDSLGSIRRFPLCPLCLQYDLCVSHSLSPLSSLCSRNIKCRFLILCKSILFVLHFLKNFLVAHMFILWNSQHLSVEPLMAQVASSSVERLSSIHCHIRESIWHKQFGILFLAYLMCKIEISKAYIWCKR